MAKKYFIIDFDSTFIKSEALEELALIVLQGNPDKGSILKEIKEITVLGMEGKISFTQSLRKRLGLLQIKKTHIKNWVRKIKTDISDSIVRHKSFFKNNWRQIYIISGSFSECILPAIEDFYIPKNHVFANSFVDCGKNGRIDVDLNNPLAFAGGKIKALQNLKLEGEIFVLGDGHNDLELKEKGAAHKFIAFCENVKRKSVVGKADAVVSDFGQFISLVESEEKIFLLEYSYENRR